MPEMKAISEWPINMSSVHRQEGLAVASIAWDDASPLPGIVGCDHNAR